MCVWELVWKLICDSLKHPAYCLKEIMIFAAITQMARLISFFLLYMIRKKIYLDYTAYL